ncbi:TIGR03089 family protein [Cellulomonas fimi]|uniref:TIGR03089 family protein n=1 Tax=Cellulomonas fimi TaxID=1708 RepID=A0A7Y0M1U2_CELFI|nr:TIGR03089 family protein [Cellulomonas fimi]
MASVLELVTADPGRPRLTWYGPGGERIELSGAVLANWVAKTTNLLVEEFNAGPGVRVGLDLPAHWRTVVWALAAWRCGACVVLGEEAGAADVVVTDRPDRHDGAAQLVAVGLPALARRFDGELPRGAVDAAEAVMTYGDVVGWVPEVEPGVDALDAATADRLAHSGLMSWALDAATAPPGARILVRLDQGRSDAVTTALQGVLGILARDGSAVMLAPQLADELDADRARLERLAATERVTADRA